MARIPPAFTVRAAAVLVFTLVLGGVGTAALASNPSWSSPVNVTTPTTGEIDMEPHITIGATGLAVAIWKHFDGAYLSVLASTSQSGRAWSTPTLISPASGYAGGEHISVDASGRATAIWHFYDGTSSSIQASTSPDGGLTWFSQGRISSPSDDAYNAQIAVDPAGHATAVWERSNDGGSTFSVEGSTSLNGDSWSSPVSVSGSGNSAYNAQLTVDNTGLATAVWQRSNDGGNYSIQASTSQNGDRWSTPVNLSEDADNSIDAQVTVDQTGLTTAIWQSTSDGGTSYSVQSSSAKNRGSWSPLAIVAATGAYSAHVRISVDVSGLATAVWTSNVGSGNSIKVSNSQSGLPWSTPTTISVSGQDSSAPFIATDPAGRSTAVWSVDAGGTFRFLTSTSQNGDPWSTPVTVATPETDARDPQIAIDSTGLATVIWSTLSGPIGWIQSSTVFNPIPGSPEIDPISEPASLSDTGLETTAMLLTGVVSLLLLVIGIGAINSQRVFRSVSRKD